MKLLLLVFPLICFEVTFGVRSDGVLGYRRAEYIPGAAPEPYVMIVDQTVNWALLQCQVRGAFPKPKLRWQDSDGNILKAEEPKVTERRDRYNVILQTNVTKTDNYRCVATQEEINHQIYAEIYMYIHEPNVIKVTVEEGSDVILPCSLSSKENIVYELFDWMKDGQKQVFVYDAGLHTNNDYPGQDEQFKGRVSHFKDELKSGNASIIIRHTTVADSGDYTCEFPQLQPRQIFYIKLVVEPNVIKVEEGSDVILPCSLSSKENIEFERFVWTRDHQKTVFVHYPYFHNRYGYPTQDEQFFRRVSHFEDELMSGNASIIIRHTKVADSGDYTCEFPHLQPRQIFHIKLHVGGVLRDRTAENIPGAAPEPYVMIVDQTKDWVLLQCQVRDALPKPELHWQDSGGNILHAEEPKESERGGDYDVILQTIVTKTDIYRCVATQEEISHQIYAEIHAIVLVSGSCTGRIVAAVFGTLCVVGVVLAVLKWKGCIILKCNTDRGAADPHNQQENVQLNTLGDPHNQQENVQLNTLGDPHNQQEALSLYTCLEEAGC